MRIESDGLRHRYLKKSHLLMFCVVLASTTSFAGINLDQECLIGWANSFVTDAKLSKQGKLPIVVFVSQSGCEFCEALRQQVLFPMIRSGKLQKAAIFREVSLDDGFTVQDFDGKTIRGSIFAERYGASVTPTLIYLDATGHELMRKTVGISNIEFYGFYLDQSLEAASATLRTQDRK